MDDLWDVETFARWKYKVPPGEKVDKPKRNVVAGMCRDGIIPAVKIGRQWYVDTGQILGVVRNA